MSDPLSRLARWRRVEGYSLQELADLTGFSVSMLSRVERGLRDFSPRNKVRFARALNVPVRDLFDVESVPDEEVASAAG